MRRTYAGYDQLDSREFLTVLLDELHEEINRNEKKKYIDHPDPRSVTSEKIERQVYKYFQSYNLLRDSSVVTDLFQGYHRWEIKCQDCDYTKVSCICFKYIELPIPQRQKPITIEDCFQEFGGPKNLSDKECPKCKKRVSAI